MLVILRLYRIFKHHTRVEPRSPQAWLRKSKMGLSDDIYAFRKTPEGMAIENFKVFQSSFPGTITSNQIHTALKDRLDVRDFSAGGQAKNLKMCARVCEEWKKGYISKVRALGFNDKLAERFVPPLNADEVCGYRRPNCHFKLDAQKPPSNFVPEIDRLIRDEFENCFGITQQALTHQLQNKKKGHIYQYIRSIVLTHYQHEISSEQAMKDWMARTGLPGGTQAGRCSGDGGDGRTKQTWDTNQLKVVRRTLERIHTYQASATVHPSQAPLTWNAFIRYIVEPLECIRDHLRTVIMFSIGIALRLNKGGTVEESIVKGIGEAISSPGIIASFFFTSNPSTSSTIQYSVFSPSTNLDQYKVLRHLVPDTTIISQEDNWQVCSILTYILPTQGHLAVAAIMRWKQKEERLAPLTSGPFGIIEIKLCDRYWLEGWPIAFMADRIALITGRDRKYIQSTLSDLSQRWTYRSGERVIDDSHLQICVRK